MGLLKCYTRDLEAFSKLTRRQKKIFDEKFKYKMHDDIVCSGLSEFDHQLNSLKSMIIKLDEQSEDEKIEKFLIDDTQIMALDEELRRFHVIVSIKIGNGQIWKRTSLVQLDEKTKLVALGQLISTEVCDDPKAQNKEKGDEKESGDHSKAIHNVLNAVKHGKNAKISGNDTNDVDSK